ncbi:MAG: adenylate kinase [Lentisphaerae bacterium GWF2_45_14]|nr:MAG: adenylate kinase [Lentisphaerae bacterium GWF2_45_14]
MKNLVLLGPPGAGKGTLSAMLREESSLPHISTGDIFRVEINKGSELGKKAEEYVNKGQLVPDEIVAEMTGSRLEEKDCADGFILDGFPRTVRQAELLEKELIKTNRKLDLVIYFKAEKDLLIKRLTARLTCKSCGINFNKIFARPRKEGICDECGGELFQRPDDSYETAVNRLKVYEEQTSPLIAFYEDKKLLSEINAGLPKEESYTALLKVLK